MRNIIIQKIFKSQIKHHFHRSPCVGLTCRNCAGKHTPTQSALSGLINISFTHRCGSPRKSRVRARL